MEDYEAKTGQRVLHYIIDKGPFEKSCKQLPPPATSRFYKSSAASVTSGLRGNKVNSQRIVFPGPGYFR